MTDNQGTHNLKRDDPHGFSRYGRLTCQRCGRAIIIRPNGTKYGSAVDEPCAKVTA